MPPHQSIHPVRGSAASVRYSKTTEGPPPPSEVFSGNWLRLVHSVRESGGSCRSVGLGKIALQGAPYGLASVRPPLRNTRGTWRNLWKPCEYSVSWAVFLLDFSARDSEMRGCAFLAYERSVTGPVEVGGYIWRHSGRSLRSERSDIGTNTRASAEHGTSWRIAAGLDLPLPCISE